MSAKTLSSLRCSEAFDKACAPDSDIRPKKKADTKPFSLRLSTDERAYLEGLAGRRPLGTYIRERLLGRRAEKRRRERKRRIDDQQIARLLAELGRSELSPNLNRLAEAADLGTLDVSWDLEQELRDACGAVLAMRDALFLALGLRAGKSAPSSSHDTVED